MNEFMIYVLKSILALAIFSFAYRAILFNEGNFRMRRVYLLISVCLSMILPLSDFRFPLVEYNFPSVVLDEVIIYSNGIRLIRETSTFPLAKTIKFIYFIIAFILIFRVLLNSTLLLIKAAKNTPHLNKEVKLFVLKDKNISYSFFRNIFIGQTADSEEQERILAHEKVHALQMHSVDVIFMEFLSGIFWFNPLVWWYRKEIKNVHEYLADQGALEAGFNRKQYQITLLEHLIGSASLSITNNFNYSLIKNRIAMMNKEKNGRKNTWKVLLIIPLSLLIVLTFACTQKNALTGANLETENQIVNTAYFEAEQMPVYPGGFEALQKFIAVNITYPTEALTKGVSGKVFVQFVVDKTGKVITGTDDFIALDKDKKETTIVGEVIVVGYKPSENSSTENTEQYVELLKKEAVRVISNLPSFEKPGMQNGAAVAVVFTIPINFALQ